MSTYNARRKSTSYARGLKLDYAEETSSSSSESMENNRSKVHVESRNNDSYAHVEKQREEYSVHVDGMKIALAAFVVILIGVVFKKSVFDLEIKLMVSVRDSFYSPWLDKVCHVILWGTELGTIQILLVALYLFTDPLLAFKCTFLVMVQIFIVSVLKIMSNIPRPYWIEDDIDVSICALDYSGPSDHICVGAQFYNYVILIYTYKYAEERDLVKTALLLALANSYIILTALSLFYMGQTFIFECISGIIYSILLVITFIKLDPAIHRYCERLGFNIKHSRREKFYLLFICCAAFIVVSVYYQMEANTFGPHPKWLRNDCLQEKFFRFQLGIDYTYFDFAKIFALVASAFGCAFATTNIEGYIIQETSLGKRLLRTIIGTSLFISFFYVCKLIPSDNYLTEYVFRRILPNFCGSYFAYGLFPLLCDYVGLIEVYESESCYSSEEDHSMHSKYLVTEIKEGTEGESDEHEQEGVPDFLLENKEQSHLIKNDSYPSASHEQSNYNGSQTPSGYLRDDQHSSYFKKDV